MTSGKLETTRCVRKSIHLSLNYKCFIRPSIQMYKIATFKFIYYRKRLLEKSLLRSCYIYQRIEQFDHIELIKLSHFLLLERIFK